VFENGSTKGRSLDSIKRSDCHVTRCRKEESDKRWNNKVNLPGIESYNGALMIWLVGIVMQPLVQGRGYRHCKNSKLRCEEPNDKKCQERGRLVSSVH
jgi:hypothetical protein